MRLHAAIPYALDWVLVLDDESKRYPAPGTHRW